MMTPSNYREAKKAGLVMVGEWGDGTRGGMGAIWCKPEDRGAVKAAYDDIRDGDLGPTVLDGVKDAGGVFVPDAE